MADRVFIKSGKTKEVYFDRESGLFVLVFTDHGTGTDGTFDPSANERGIAMEGFASESLRLSSLFFSKLENVGFCTHMESFNLASNEMHVKPATMFANGLEFIVRFNSDDTSSFHKRFGMYNIPHQAFETPVFEITLKDDERKDPFINEDSLLALGILQKDEYTVLRHVTLGAAYLIADEFKKKGAEIYDMKLELAWLIHPNGAKQIMIIDEISAGIMKVYKDGKKLTPHEIYLLFSSET